MIISYSALSEFYDELNAHVDYTRFADFYERIFRKFAIKPEIVLDLACGTGTLTEIMASRGYDMIGIDSSDTMLNIAQNKREKSGFDILYLNQDMSSFELYGTVSAVICSLDSVNHMTDKRDVADCFFNCHMYLDYGGVFIFDVNTPYRLKNTLNGTAAVFETENVYCGVEHSYDAKCRRFYYDMTIFNKMSDGTYERKDDFVEERPYEIEELSELLYASGFDKVYVYDDFKMKKPKDNCERAVFVAVKEKEK